jgi:hypothetical protein
MLGAPVFGVGQNFADDVPLLRGLAIVFERLIWTVVNQSFCFAGD